MTNFGLLYIYIYINQSLFEWSDSNLLTCFYLKNVDIDLEKPLNIRVNVPFVHAVILPKFLDEKFTKYMT